MICKKAVVEGRVQGVWFRASTRLRAKKLGLTGSAINCQDGSVEVLACGAAEAVEQLIKWLHQGPPLAQVQRVAVEEYCCDVPPTEFVTG